MKEVKLQTASVVEPASSALNKDSSKNESNETISHELIGQALQELEDRRCRESTYTAPLHVTADMREFLKSFYRSVYTPQKELFYETERKNFPIVEQFYQKLCCGNGVSSEDFWQRYEYRCGNLERIIRELSQAEVANDISRCLYPNSPPDMKTNSSLHDLPSKQIMPEQSSRSIVFSKYQEETVALSNQKHLQQSPLLATSPQSRGEHFDAQRPELNPRVEIDQTSKNSDNARDTEEDEHCRNELDAKRDIIIEDAACQLWDEIHSKWEKENTCKHQAEDKQVPCDIPNLISHCDNSVVADRASSDMPCGSEPSQRGNEKKYIDFVKEELETTNGKQKNPENVTHKKSNSEVGDIAMTTDENYSGSMSDETTSLLKPSTHNEPCTTLNSEESTNLGNDGPNTVLTTWNLNVSPCITKSSTIATDFIATTSSIQLKANPHQDEQAALTDGLLNDLISSEMRNNTEELNPSSSTAKNAYHETRCLDTKVTKDLTPVADMESLFVKSIGALAPLKHIRISGPTILDSTDDIGFSLSDSSRQVEGTSKEVDGESDYIDDNEGSQKEECECTACVIM